MHREDQQRTPLLILGAGYTGQYLYAEARKRGLPVLATSRSPDSRLTGIRASHRIWFDLQKRETWHNILSGADVVWCFPAVPEELVQAFAEDTLIKTGRLVVLGSTSAYDLPESVGIAAAPVIDESAPVDRNRPRVRGEEYLREHHHAIVLRVAGIYGPGRHVLDWIRRGKVGPSRRYVNLVHVEDLAALCILALERGKPGDVYNVSDGSPRRWSDICEEARRKWGITAQTVTEAKSLGKRISIAKLHAEFAYAFRHPDLFTALESIESAEA
ncbi:MAG: NAD-dependent epimerase/dehydratase family protein [Nitrospiraceae bacterium]